MRHKLFDLRARPAVGRFVSIRYRCAILFAIGKDRRTTSDRWSVGQRVTTPNGFVAEIVSVGEERALIRYLSEPPGSEDTELPLGLLRPVTAHDLLRAGIK